ncbi:MAG: TRAM domain-containing protein, partial [Bowdeniella nasicola]|nr:TRAM domain-containing protein [Bowdeniella nasicola]
TDADFERTLQVVEASRFASAYTFQYSPRPGTPAADRTDQIPADVMAERYQRLVALQNRISTEENEAQVGREVEVLIREDTGRKDQTTARVSGYAADNRLVHIAIPAGTTPPRPGDMVTAQVTHGAPHYLIADSPLHGGTYRVRATRAGDAWQAAQVAKAEAMRPATEVSLGIPTIGRRPAPPQS